MWLFSLLSLNAAALLIYSQTWAFTWDESYHLLAAQLIAKGKTPYIDFCFPQTPLNAYWNAGWMRLLGEKWRVAHGISALLAIGAVLLTADYVLRRFPIHSWRVAAAITAGLAIGLNSMVFIYGAVAQAYGLCLLALVVAFRISVRAVDQSPMLAAAAGLFAGIAAGSSLLTAAAVPVLLVWIVLYNHMGNRWAKLIAFLTGLAIPFAPVFWLFAKGPRQTWFNVFQYHALYRKLYWPETTRHDIEILTSWIDSGQAIVLGLLAVFGLLYVVRKSSWPPMLKAEFYLCAWLAAGLSAEISRAHPTFARYFLLTVPFLAIPAVAGLYAVASATLGPDRPVWPALLVTTLLAMGLGKAIYERRIVDNWSTYEQQAAKVDQVTAPGAPLFANEPIYFLTKRTPPPGFELYYTHKINLPPAEAALLHILSDAEVKRQVQSRMFSTAYSCEDDEIDDYGLKDLYKQHVEMGDCTIFWDLKK